MAEVPNMTLWFCGPGVVRSVRPAWLIKEMGAEDKVQYKYVDIDASPPPQEREEFRQKVHPHSTVPALEIEGGPTMLESSSMCLYLAELAGGKFAPEPTKRAEYYEWIMYTMCTLDVSLDLLCQQWSQWYGPKDKSEEVVAKARATVDLCLNKVETTLKDGGPFILGDKFTAADCVLGFSLYWAADPEMNGGVLVKEFPNINTYLDRIKARPALQEALKMSKPGQ